MLDPVENGGRRMSSNPDPKPQRRKRMLPAVGDPPTRPAAAGQYEVGYGKPPVSTRFVKGQSGNPHGRPRKPEPRRTRLSDAPSDSYLEEEAYRLVTLRERAGNRAADAAGGRAVSRDGSGQGETAFAEYFLEYVARLGGTYICGSRRNTSCGWRASSGTARRALRRAARRGLPPPVLLPHPEDIVLRPSTCEAFRTGPETPEDVPLYEYAARQRDFSLLRADTQNKIYKKTAAKPEEALTGRGYSLRPPS